MEDVLIWIAFAASAIEALAVAVMFSVIAFATVRWLLKLGQIGVSAYEVYRVTVGKSILVGLELLVAADIIRTVALTTTPTNVAILIVLVLIRTFLGWTLALEVEGRWPWQSVRVEGGDQGQRKTSHADKDRINGNTHK